jgi:hypothetical protein
MRRLLLAGFLLLLVGPPAQAVEFRKGADWRLYRNDRFGVTLWYPERFFRHERTSPGGDADLFVSRTGSARLLIGALRNEDGHTTSSYQREIERRSYGGFQVTYRRTSRDWFVMSGQGEGKIFYEKVIFSCVGQVINSFTLVYDVRARRVYDRVVEAIEPTLRPGGCQVDGVSGPAER